MISPTSGTVLVVGAAGYFGRLLVADLLATGDARLVLAGRDARKLDRLACELGEPDRIATRPLVLEDERAVASALTGVQVAVCAAGPFQGLPLTLPRLCLERGIAYVDLADDRRFAAEVHALAAAAPHVAAPICCGWSAVPALAAVLVRIAAADLAAITAIDVHLAPGNRAPRAHATVASLLASVGRSFAVWRDGRWQEVRGWSEPRGFTFPPPIGWRTGYLVDVPAHDELPARFACARAEFRVSAEIAFLNRALAGLALLVRARVVPSLVPWTPVLRRAMALLGGLGSEAGALGVEVAGMRAGQSVRRHACVIARDGAPRIPVMPAAIMVARCLGAARPAPGVVPADRWIERPALEAECAQRGFRLVIEVPDAEGDAR